MQKHIYTFLILCLCIVPLFAQSDLEKELLSKIQKIDSDVFDANNHTMSIQPMLKSYQGLSKQVKNDNQLGAIINTKIGQALTKKNYHEDAIPFLIKAYKHRKTQGEYFPQRWALKALINNGLSREDFKFAFKYTKVWITHMKTHPEKLKEVHRYGYSLEKVVSTEIEYWIKRFHYLSRYKKYDLESTRLQKGRVYVPKLIQYCYKELPEYQSVVSWSARDFYQLFIRVLVESELDELAFQVKDKSLKQLKKNASSEHYADYVRHIATWFRKKGVEMQSYGDYTFETETFGTKTTKHEAIGVELIDEYIQVSKEISNKDQVLFGYRYIATRYIVLEDYQKAVQYLATAIKYCHEYGMEEEIDKSIGGLQVLRSTIIKKKNRSLLQAAQNWREGYSLNGLTEQDIKRIDWVLNIMDSEQW